MAASPWNWLGLLASSSSSPMPTTATKGATTQHHGGKHAHHPQHRLNAVTRVVLGALRLGPVPAHLALIMDGNRRHGVKQYATRGTTTKKEKEEEEPKRNAAAFRVGHEAGFEALLRAMKWSFELGVERLTVFAFSQENWKRDASEVEQLVAMLADKLRQMEDEEGVVRKMGVHVEILGDISNFPEDVRHACLRLERLTKVRCISEDSSEEEGNVHTNIYV